MRAGLLDTRLVIQSRTLAQDALGGPIENWTTFAAVWAERRDQPSREFANGRLLQREAIRQTTLRIRYLAGVKTTMRALFDGRIANITSVGAVGRKAALDLTVEDING